MNKKDTKTGRFLKGGELSIEVRFIAKVIKTSTCWLWTGAKTRDGYGHIIYNGRYRKAPQIAWELANGRPFPKELWALHTCNNPGCVNPEHIYPGTARDNHLDAVKSGTFLSGDRSPKAKITSQQVAEIRSFPKLKQRELAVRYGVSQSHISDIQNYKKRR